MKRFADFPFIRWIVGYAVIAFTVATFFGENIRQYLSRILALTAGLGIFAPIAVYFFVLIQTPTDKLTQDQQAIRQSLKGPGIFLLSFIALSFVITTITKIGDWFFN